ncbi:MAG: YkuS family protein [Chitinophagales bacterium]
MSIVVAVDKNLSLVKEYLVAQGCQIVDVIEANYGSVDAIVLSGGDQNLMGIGNTETKAPVIDARGKTPHEVWQSLKQR